MEKCSFSQELNTSRAIKYVNSCIEYDNSIPDFFTAVTNSNEIQYFRSNSADDIFTISSNAPFPEIIGPHYITANQIGTCGILPKIQRYYYILDNKLFLWHVNTAPYDTGVVEPILEEAQIITAVATIDPNAFFTKSTSGLLAVATPTYIKVYPVSDDKIDIESAFTTNQELNFTPICICSGDPGQLFIGATDGHLYSIHADIDQQITDENQGPFIVKNLTSVFLISSIMNFLTSSRSPIWKICYDPSTSYLASIDSNNTIKFYSHSNNSLSKNYTFTPPNDLKFVAIVPVDRCDSQTIRFIGFTKKGDRFYFGTNSPSSSKIALRGQRKPPVEIGQHEVVDAFYSCGYTALLCKDSILAIQSFNLDSSQTNCYEFVAKSGISGYGICIVGSPFGLSGSDNRIYHEPLLSQHLNFIPDLYVLTSRGGCIMKFKPPAAFIHQFITEKKKNFTYNKDITELMQRFSINDECCAFCILLAYLYPDRSSDYLYIASEYSRRFSLSCHIEGEDGMTAETQDTIIGPDNLTPITHAFYVCASRLLTLIWSIPIFQSTKETLWKISLQFRTLSPDFLMRLTQLIKLSHEYLNAQTNASHENERQELLFEIEKGQLKVFQSFVEEMIEIVKCINILGKQKSEFLSLPFQFLDTKLAERLTVSPFAPTPETTVYLLHALREYIALLFSKFKEIIDQDKKSLNSMPVPSKDGEIPFGYNPLSAIGPETKLHPYQLEATMNLLATEINTDCPTITKSAEYQIIQAKKQLEEASFVQSPTEKKRLVHNAAEIFLSNCTRNLEFDSINKACTSLIRLGFDEYAVKIVETHVRYLDEAERAYFWYVNGCNEKELNSIKIFDQVQSIYKCAYDAAFSDDGMKAILETEDQLFILLVLQHLLHANEINRLLHLEHPLVLEFLTENAPKLVAQYYITHKRYKEAVNYLITYASNINAPDDHPESEVSFDRRAELLQSAMNCARKENLIEQIEECKIRIECCKLQKQMSSCIGEPLKPLNELFQYAEDHALWSYLLRIIVLMPVDDIIQREKDIYTVWFNFLLNGDGSQQQQTNSIREKDINQKLESIFNEIGLNTDVMNPNYVAPVLEDFRNYMNERDNNVVGEFASRWVVDTLLKLNMDGSKLYAAYASVINRDSTPEERCNQLIDAALSILRRGYIGDLSLIKEKIQKLLEDPQSSYYQQIRESMDILE